MMMNEKNDASEKNNIDDLMLPGFRFHPTDEELVGFYLKKKLQQKTLPIELIKQVDIYKYDPWDLPNLAFTGEKEWYFYCPRDRKYRNSTRPNRVTGSGFWKATGTDRPIYSSNGNRCIGLKKSLVFYRGRAAKGIKTDWMMHEFRLPSITDGSVSQPPKKIFDKNIPANDSWAVCRIFKKANSAANRALSHPWITAASMSETDDFSYSPHHQTLITSENMSSTAKHDLQPMNFSALNIPGNLIFSPHEEVSGTNNRNTLELASVSPAVLTSDDFDGPPPPCQFGGFSVNPSREMQTSVNGEEEQEGLRKNQNAMNVSYLRSMGFPFDLQSSGLQDSWRQPNFSWDDSPTCPSEISSTTHSTNYLYT